MVKKKYVVTYQIKRSILGKTYIQKGDPITIEAGTFKEARQIFKDNNKSTPNNKAINIKVIEKEG